MHINITYVVDDDERLDELLRLLLRAEEDGAITPEARRRLATRRDGVQVLPRVLMEQVVREVAAGAGPRTAMLRAIRRAGLTDPRRTYLVTPMSYVGQWRRGLFGRHS